MEYHSSGGGGLGGDPWGRFGPGNTDAKLWVHACPYINFALPANISFWFFAGGVVICVI